MKQFILTHKKHITLSYIKYGIYGICIYIKFTFSLILNKLLGIKFIIKIKNPLDKNYNIYLRSIGSDIYTYYEIFLDEPFKKYEFKNKIINIIDLGGNIGLSTLFFKTQYEHVKIYTVEPDAGNFAILQKNIEQYSNIIGINKGIWDKNTFIYIKNTEDSECAFIVEEGKKDHSIESITLDSLIAEYSIKNIDILKIDIEGSEEKILKENQKWLSITNKIFIEVHEKIIPGIKKMTIDILQKNNFSLNTEKENYFIGEKK